MKSLIVIFIALFSLSYSGARGGDTASIKSYRITGVNTTDSTFTLVTGTEITFRKPVGVDFTFAEYDSLLYSPNHKITKRIDEPPRSASYWPVNFLLPYKNIEYIFNPKDGRISEKSKGEELFDWETMGLVNSWFPYGYAVVCLLSFLGILVGFRGVIKDGEYFKISILKIAVSGVSLAITLIIALIMIATLNNFSLLVLPLAGLVTIGWIVAFALHKVLGNKKNTSQ